MVIPATTLFHKLVKKAGIPLKKVMMLFPTSLKYCRKVPENHAPKTFAPVCSVFQRF